MNIVGGRKARAAYYFAAGAHGAIKQLRKYTDEAYIVHPAEVAKIVSTVPHTEDMLAAAYLHDVVEDTPVTDHTIEELFGEQIANLVFGLTDLFTKENAPMMNRAARKRMEAFRLSEACAEVQTIKVADLISNTRTIVQYDQSFAKVYLEEKAYLLSVLTKADPHLLEQARQLTQEH